MKKLGKRIPSIRVRVYDLGDYTRKILVKTKYDTFEIYLVYEETGSHCLDFYRLIVNDTGVCTFEHSHLPFYKFAEGLPRSVFDEIYRKVNKDIYEYKEANK